MDTMKVPAIHENLFLTWMAESIIGMQHFHLLSFATICPSANPQAVEQAILSLELDEGQIAALELIGDITSWPEVPCASLRFNT